MPWARGTREGPGSGWPRRGPEREHVRRTTYVGVAAKAGGEVVFTTVDPPARLLCVPTTLLWSPWGVLIHDVGQAWWDPGLRMRVKKKKKKKKATQTKAE